MSYANIANLVPIRADRLIKEMEEDKMWGDIRRLTKTSPALQEQLDKVISICLIN